MTLPGVVAIFSPMWKCSRLVIFTLKLPLLRSRSCSHVRDALKQVLALAFDGRLEDFGIGRREVGGRHRVNELAGIELHLLGRVVVKPVDPLDRRLQVPGGQQVALLDAVENDVLGPCFVLEAAVGRRRVATGSNSLLNRNLPMPFCHSSAMLFQ